MCTLASCDGVGQSESWQFQSWQASLAGRSQAPPGWQLQSPLPVRLTFQSSGTCDVGHHSKLWLSDLRDLAGTCPSTDTTSVQVFLCWRW